ncbi:MAG: EAL domain-containing protein [Lachnospiraceae bacterium]|nr:EAL domain-containing protein [Lachnospiraceae bacterium]
MRKRIGVILAQLEENMQKRFMQAFLKEAYAKDYDVCIFSMYQKFQQTELRNIGDSNIFSLINYEYFDGLLVLTDTLQTPGLEKRIFHKIKKNFGGPVITVDKENDLFEYVLMDHFSPIVEIMNHLIEVHGYKDIAFLSGREGHPHSVQRLSGYRVAMKNHNLPIREDRIYHGNYWYDSGHAFAEELLKNPDDMPEAVACASDIMAIGLAARLSEHGYRIPEDIAVVGYDSCQEGRTAPVPLTSANIPAAQCGKICFYKLHSAISGEPVPEIPLEPEILIGGSCGCKNFEASFKKLNRSQWKTDNSEVSYYSDFNHITEDMLCQTDYEKFFETLATYSYQIRPFEHFSICMNEDFLNPAALIGENARRTGYSSRMNQVVRVGQKLPDQDVGCVDLNRSFDSKIMFPDIFEERDYPTTFIFLPMFFEDRCFGYVVFNQGRSLKLYTETVRIWMRNVNQGIESFYRERALSNLIAQIKADQIRDKQTGLYNYKGFHEKFEELIQNSLNKDNSVAIIAFDLDNLSGINEEFSRAVGDSAIESLARFVSYMAADNEICARLSNDEFLLGIINSDCEARYHEIISRIPEKGISFKDSSGERQCALIHHSMRQNPAGVAPNLDFLINRAVNAKNYAKKIMQRSAEAEMTEELLAKCNVVRDILDHALLCYYFQPIIYANTGEIYGYEALMRDESETHLSPLEILDCAGRLGRLYDVEKITFDGVLNQVESKPEAFKDRKVFVNSLPAYQLTEEDEKAIFQRLAGHRGKLVVEYTEQSEFSDAALSKRKADYASLQIEIALDDYGSGFSNVNNLIRYTPKYVKIDHQLINGINSNAQKRHFVSSIIDYAGKNDILVLAEGVETLEELRTVIGLGVDLIQGFYTGRPAKEPVSKIKHDIRSEIRHSYLTRRNPGIY